MSANLSGSEAAVRGSFHSENQPKPQQPTSKKYQKIKYEIDRQNFLIGKLCRELKMKTEQCVPENCLQKLQCELCNEQKKLDAMIKHAMGEQKRCGDENWGPIPVAVDDREPLEPPQTPSDISKISGFSDLQLSELQLDDYEDLEDDRFQLQQEILSKDLTLQDLESKLEKMQCKLLDMCQENKSMAQKLGKSQSVKSQQEMNDKLNLQVENATKLSSSIEKLSAHLNDLRNELAGLKKEKKIAFEMGRSSMTEADGFRPKTCPCKGDDDTRKVKVLESQYLNLQTEYCRKEKQCKEMIERMKNLIDSSNDDKERAVNEALKKRADEMVEEINDNKVFIRELQQQVDVYRDKFMKAQEKVESQRYLLENLELNNKDVESQINDEISRIKEKFQQKLSELCPYPKKYEESKVELEEAKKRISGLESDLKSVVAALARSSDELKALKENPDESLATKYKKLQCEVEMLKKKYCGIKSTKECLEEKLTCMKKELEALRKDSSKIITTTKCCAEKNRDILHQHINCLEIELAQCRASASHSLAQKEEIIKRMKDELSSLCGHFNDCQGQIKQLKNQVTYLTNQRHKIRPSDLDNIDYCHPDF